MLDTGGQGGVRNPGAAPGDAADEHSHLSADSLLEMTDADVARGFCAGNERALGEAYRRWSPLVHTVALRSAGNPNDAAEITSEVFVDAWRGRVAYSPAAGSLAGWLMTITCRRIVDRHESRTRRTSVSPARGPASSPADGVAGDAAQIASRLLVVSELDRLSEPARRVMRLALRDDLTQRQIAERLDMPNATVRSHLRGSLSRVLATISGVGDAR